MSNQTLSAPPLTIGLLTSIVHQPFWLGVVDAARRRGANLLCFIGGTLPTRGQPLLRVPYSQRLPGLSFFSLTNSPRLDGVITWGGSKAGFSMNLDDAEMEEFIAPYRRLPLINYEGRIAGVPSVVTDTHQGMCALIEHLIEHHQRRRIAFIRGPVGHLESEERFLAYQETLQRYGIPFDPALVYQDSQWGKIVGAEAVHTLVRQRGVRPGIDVDAVIGSEVDYAVGALQTLQEYGVRVPNEVAVAGFNDHLDAQTLELPITVMAKPFYEAGVVAVDALLDMIDGKSIPDRISVPARLIVRRSCGCWSLACPEPLPQTLTGDAPAMRPSAPAEPSGDPLVARIVRLRESMDPAMDRSWLDGLIEGLSPESPERENEARDRFWSGFEHELSRRRISQGMAQWHDLISELLHLVVSALANPDRLPEKNRLFLQRVRLTLAQERERARIELRTQTVEQSHILLEISQSMLVTQDVDHLLDVLAQRLPEMRIRDCYLVLFDDFTQTIASEAPGEGRVVLALQEGRRLPLSADGIPFLSRWIVPDELLHDHQPYALVVSPLFFGLRDFGIIAVQADLREGRVYQKLAQEISSALQSVFLWRDYHRSEYARRESEARLHTLIEHMPVALWAKDADGRYLMQNSVMRALMEDNSSLERNSSFVAVQEEWRLYESWAFEGRTVSFEYTLPVQDQTRLFKQIIAPVRVDGAVTAILGLMFDITEQRTVEKSLLAAIDSAEEARRNAESANRSKSVFLSNISHELRTPLNSILGYAQILHHDPATPDHQRKSLQTIRSSGEHLLNLIDDLLDLAKAEAGKIQLQPVAFDLNAMMTSIAGMVQERAVAKNLTFVQAIGHVPPIVTGDQKRLKQVLINLLSNAVKFTRHGTVTLQVDPTPDLPGFVRFQVIDTGIGIDPQHFETIFRPFEQLQTQTGETGTGLGLAISSELVALMGGTLQVESMPGVGSRFWFDIPLSPVQHAASPAAPTKRQIIGVAGPAPKVLVVDDHPGNRAVVCEMLQPLGIITAKACDGTEGLSRIAEFGPDAVILDLVMPGMNGVEMIRRIRRCAAYDHIVLIVSSASAYPDDRRQSLEAGAQAFIPKPVDRTVLIETLQRCLPWVEWRSVEVSEESSSWTVDALPPDDTMASLLELARIGDIDGLQRAIDRLAQTMPQMTSFSVHVRHLLETFQIGQLQAFLRQARGKP